ncbi:Predicted arabinose efflux permease, MFS family [Halopelagius inordinatus]|uniref:Predicted arabinose efflux permease, MFS family n=1 Tax=Halopelagius inordinatus TaxID=553467 RepID=A0A1I2NYS6_9EURY|nr:MFS transporter [Halopelagius inordinatus]SFG09115.1 Predicted arabinose efflux permease, MFS family [Halopelagius inordinatus]
MADRFGVDPQVLALAVARMTESVGNSFLVVVLPLFIGSQYITGATFGLTEVAVTGIILSLFGLVNSPLQPFTGRLSDRARRRKVFVLVGLVLIGVASFSYSFASTYWHLLGLRVVQGIAGALIIPTTVALVNDLASESNRGGNMGTYNTFRLLGFGVGPIAAGAVVASGPFAFDVGTVALRINGFDAAFYIATLTATLSFGLVSAFVRDPEVPEADAGDALLGSLSVRDRSSGHVLDPVFTLGLASFFMAVGIALFATLGEIVNERLAQDATMFGLQFAAFVLAQIFLQAPIGRATDFFGRKPFIVLGMVLLVPTTFVQGFVLDSWLMFGARFAQGIAGAMVFAPALALAGDLAPAGQSGSTLSVLTMAFGFGVALGPLASGFLVAFGFAVPFAFGSALAVVGAVLVWTQVEESVATRRSFLDPFSKAGENE